MHMGSTIKLKWLQDWVMFIRGTYIMPPIGGLYTQMSTTDKGGRELLSYLRNPFFGCHIALYLYGLLRF